MSHTHIGSEDRACIARMLRAGHSLREIARTINKDPGSVSRHVRKYGGRDGYDLREVRRKKRMQRIAAMDSIRRIRGYLLRFITKELKLHKSPDEDEGVRNLHYLLNPPRCRIVVSNPNRSTVFANQASLP